MSQKSFTTSFTVDQSPEQVYAAINDVRAWWTGEITGRTDELGAEFEYRYTNVHRSTQKVTELVPGKRIVWHVTKARLSFTDEAEWVGTSLVFEIARKGGKTEVHFTHVGLVPAKQCYRDCSGAWSYLVTESLRGLITTGLGDPGSKGKKKGAGAFASEA